MIENDAHQRREAFRFAFAAAAGLALLCVAVGESAPDWIDPPQGQTAARSAPTAPVFGAIDPSPTGSGKRQIQRTAPE